MTAASELSGDLLRLQAALDSMRETIRDHADELSRVEAERDEYKRRCESYEQQELGADPPAGGGRRMSRLIDRIASLILTEVEYGDADDSAQICQNAAARIVDELGLPESTEAAQNECECARFHAAREAESERRDAEDQS